MVMTSKARSACANSDETAFVSREPPIVLLVDTYLIVRWVNACCVDIFRTGIGNVLEQSNEECCFPPIDDATALGENFVILVSLRTNLNSKDRDCFRCDYFPYRSILESGTVTFLQERRDAMDGINSREVTRNVVSNSLDTIDSCCCCEYLSYRSWC